MACIMEPKVDSDGQHLAWDPATIPLTKPFVNICTTPYEPLTSFEDMNFVKTCSSIYSIFHKNVRSVNFEIGYSKGAKWFQSLNDKWAEYTNFYIGGFLEAIYSSNGKNTGATFAQVDAKLIDFDTKLRQPSASQSTSPKFTNNAFTKRRSQSSLTTPNHNSFTMSNSNSIIIDDTENDEPEVHESSTPGQRMATDDPEFNEFFNYYQKMKLQKSPSSTQILKQKIQ